MSNTTDTAALMDWALAPWRIAMNAANGWPLAFAPQALSQPINPGWSFGNVINVTEANSSAPDTEQEIVRHHSYGRQIGRMMEAIELLIEKSPPAVKNDPRADALRQIQQDIQSIKQSQSRRRLEHLRDELVELKRTDPKAWKSLAATLRDGVPG